MKRFLLVFAAVLGLASGTAAFAATLGVGSWHLWAGSQTLTKGTCTLNPSQDTYVDESTSTTSYGSATYIGTRTGAGQRARSFVQFDLSSCNIPSNGGADSATLKFTVLQAPTSTRSIAVAPVNSSWSESLTWNGSLSLSIGSATTTFSVGTGGGTVSANVTNDVDSWIRGGTNRGWRLADTGGASVTTVFDSSEATSGNPQLVINYEK
jgi:hypothetical protein